MTERLYYTDAYVTEFDAAVIRVERHQGRPAVVLDRTAFYPTSGGQPYDTGHLGEVSVEEVLEGPDGMILHVMERGLSPGPVHGRIDWPRRFEHMQQHTGQHVLSAAFDRVHRARTESFHLGSASATIDLDRVLSPAEIELAEGEANRVVWEDRPVTVRVVDAEEAAALPLRKEPARAGRLRLVEVEEFDMSACGGTHVARTGAIGTIAVAGTERFRGGTRVEFFCGVRALRSYRGLRDAVASSVRLISVLPVGLPSGIERLQTELRESKRHLKDLQARLASFEAATLTEKAALYGTARVAVEALEGWDANGLKTIASAITARPGHIAALFSVPPPCSVVIARAADVSMDCAAALRELTERFGGNGGGRADLAQGGGVQGPPDALLAFLRAALALKLNPEAEA